jgi:hypothetical protein
MIEGESLPISKFEQGNRVAFEYIGAIHARKPFSVATITEVIKESGRFHYRLEADEPVAIKTSPFSGFSTTKIGVHGSFLTLFYDQPQLPKEK